MTKPANFTYWFARLATGLLGLLLFLTALFFYSPDGDEAANPWPVTRIILLLIGLSLLLGGAILFIRPLQVWLMRSFALRAMSPNSVILLSLVQVVIFCAGLSVCVVVLAADWLNLDPTPGFGKMRALQLAAGLSLLLATYMLHSKPLQRLIIRFIGEYYMGHLRIIILSRARWLLLLAGLITTFLVTMADVLGIDPTPGWGKDRTIQLFVGLSLLGASLILQNRAMKAWFLRTSGFRMMSPVQLAVLLVLRVLVVVAGCTVTALVLFADLLGIDPTPGWGADRLIQLFVGLGLIAAGFVLHNRRFWRRMHTKSVPPPPRASN